MAREATKQEEFLEAAFDFGQWIERHWKTVLRWVAVVILVAIVIAAIFGWKGMRTAQATESMESGTAAFNKAAAAQFGDIDALADALVHFEAAEKKVGSSAPGPLATYYRGVTLFRLGRSEEAIEALTAFLGKSGDDEPLAWAGRGLLARLHADGGDTAAASALLEEVLDGDSGYPADQALLQLGLIQSGAGDTASARANWQRVVDEFGGSASANQARELLGN